MKRLFLILFTFCFSASFASASEAAVSASSTKSEQLSILKKLGKRPDFFKPWRSESLRSVVLEKVLLSSDRKTVRLYCNVGLAQISIRQELLDQWADSVRARLGEKYADCNVRFYAYNIPAERFIPNYYRSSADRDPKRTGTPANTRPLVRRTDRSLYGRGLGGRHIALWGGHGKYYHEEDDSAWKWQRPALFCTIEDLNTQEFTSRYLAPMLENAGAVVVMARERDPQPIEIIADNDRSSAGAGIEPSGSWIKRPEGFAPQDTLHTQNPFRQGTVLEAKTGPGLNPKITYLPGVQTPGEYGVYVSWKAQPTNLTQVKYTVYHAGGTAEFEVNQRIGGGMWVWLGTFPLNGDSKIVLSAPDNAPEGTITADAVKIGGGMGHVERAGLLSGVSRYQEAARYWMQYCGVPDSIYAQETISPDNKEHRMLDYTDNFKGNGDWCNYIRRQKQIPLDLALGLHSDAGICDSIVGTLSIHYTNRCRSTYTNGKSKLAGRDLADLVQTQIVHDIRAKYDSTWTRRSMYDKSYAEISRPDMPAILVEMFSHQNANDMAIALDPAFRFDMARAIYKGVLRFLADRYGVNYTVQPLPVRSLRAELAGGDSVLLKWEAAVDPLEPTATPTRYRISRRTGRTGAFDNGTETRFTEIKLPVPRDGRIYSYRVTAINEGGESFPSEIVCAGLATEERGRALVVNGFTRVSPPALKRNETGRVVGFDTDADPGVPDRQDRALVGPQTDFDPLSAFVDNDTPGWGASATTWVGQGRVGNSFDYIAQHGEALLQAGFSVASTSREAFEQMPIRPSQYQIVDLFVGAQRNYPNRYHIFSQQIFDQFNRLSQAKIPVIVSGSYLGSDPDVPAEMKQLLGYAGGETLTNPFGESGNCYRTPTIDRLQPTGEANLVQSDLLPVSGVRSGEFRTFGFPLEMLGQDTLCKLFLQLFPLPVAEPKPATQPKVLPETPKTIQAPTENRPRARHIRKKR
ncbi:N-acetylmuramoyl-L-alanine amidase [Millionella massiliensis]|mgnify:CR=1 FL=1|uniref:golvesin C-terminal-like domain-containing protein n=1 Tax=Millionella massiliensis TaxID=1871023 RepID=UPI0024B6DDEB|nr:N-acetylmuramoyl-L-alanine amidase [Millionella massiliensis]